MSLVNPPSDAGCYDTGEVVWRGPRGRTTVTDWKLFGDADPLASSDKLEEGFGFPIIKHI